MKKACFSLQRNKLFDLVPQERLELSRLSAPASKTGVSTIPPPGHGLSVRENSRHTSAKPIILLEIFVNLKPEW